jgi:hypothetical protein
MQPSGLEIERGMTRRAERVLEWLQSQACQVWGDGRIFVAPRIPDRRAETKHADMIETNGHANELPTAGSD